MNNDVNYNRTKKIKNKAILFFISVCLMIGASSSSCWTNPYARPDKKDQPSPAESLWLMPFLGGSFSPGSTPIQRQIVFIRADSAQPDLYVIQRINVDGTGLTTVYSTNTAGINAWSVRWSPDRSKLLIGGSNGANTEARVINADGSGYFLLRSIASASLCGGSISWWDNVSAIHTFGINPNFHVYRINIDGTGNTQIVNFSLFGGGDCVMQPARSPDGTKILLMNHGSGNTLHYLYTVNSDGVTGVTDLGLYTYNVDPRWSPDQLKISYNDWTGTWQPDYANSNGTGVTVVSAFFTTVHTWYDSASWLYFDTTTRQLRRRNLDGSGMSTIMTLGPTESIVDLDY